MAVNSLVSLQASLFDLIIKLLMGTALLTEHQHKEFHLFLW